MKRHGCQSLEVPPSPTQKLISSRSLGGQVNFTIQASNALAEKMARLAVAHHAWAAKFALEGHGALKTRTGLGISRIEWKCISTNGPSLRTRHGTSCHAWQALEEDKISWADPASCPASFTGYPGMLSLRQCRRRCTLLRRRLDQASAYATSMDQPITAGRPRATDPIMNGSAATAAESQARCSMASDTTERSAA